MSGWVWLQVGIAAVTWVAVAVTVFYRRQTLRSQRALIQLLHDRVVELQRERDDLKRRLASSADR